MQLVYIHKQWHNKQHWTLFTICIDIICCWQHANHCHVAHFTGVLVWQCLHLKHLAVLSPDMCTGLWWLARNDPGSTEVVDPVSANSKAKVSLNAFWCKRTSPLFLPCYLCKIHSQKQCPWSGKRKSTFCARPCCILSGHLIGQLPPCI